MAQTPSTMLPLGTPCPTFSLPDARTGSPVASSTFAGKPLLVMFICNHCPFVVHVRDELTRLAKDCAMKGVGVVAINSNSTKTHPQDGPDAMARLAKELGWAFPFCFDESQEVARAFHAACTPDFFLFGADGKLAYRGQLDDARPGNGKPVTGADLRAAIDAVVAGKAPSEDQKPSVGCNIKWHPA
jgi:thiol-disulfide isomerase/thioredoxin